MSELLSSFEREQFYEDELLSINGMLTQWGVFVDDHLNTVILKELIDDGKVKFKPKFRIKTALSYVRKALYKGYDYKDPITEIKDKVATRVVLMITRNINDVRDAILNDTNWTSALSRDYQSEIENKPELFAYQSVHIIVSPNDDYKVDIADMPKLTCEIQIRSFLQHAYSEVSHDTTYKGPYKNDTKILRNLSTSMALMEATDEYFCKIFETMLDQTRKYNLYLKELSEMFGKLKKDFDPNSVDIEVSDLILSLVRRHNVELSDVEEFIQQRGDEIKQALQEKNGLLFQQPVILLIAYFLFNLEGTLNENWPLSKLTLDSVYRAFGISTESLRFS